MAALSRILVGVLPAIRSIRPALAPALRGHGGDLTDRAGGRVRGVLVSAQVGIACVLLIGAGLLVQSVSHTFDADLGFPTRDALLLSVELPTSWQPAAADAYYDEARQDRRASGRGVGGHGADADAGARRERGFQPEGYAGASGRGS